MPQENWHTGKALHNLDTNNYLRSDPNQYIDWETTTLFYVAVHLIEAYFARMNIHPQNHLERKRYINVYLQTIRTDYMNLYNSARRARYMVDIFALERDAAWRSLVAIRAFFHPQGIQI